ncbi:hypothetical protein DYB26_004792 [Aphanomyces astaci]|uniref:Uncharacterized protein n=1 Tax=Aphanomyces astaci TaxID=112090 RepID=A0A418CH32_APHAT|nr:hypothetical protein DYB26_004792 [Aphanomyces astaci]
MLNEGKSAGTATLVAGEAAVAAATEAADTPGPVRTHRREVPRRRGRRPPPPPRRRHRWRRLQRPMNRQRPPRRCPLLVSWPRLNSSCKRRTRRTANLPRRRRRLGWPCLAWTTTTPPSRSESSSRWTTRTKRSWRRPSKPRWGCPLVWKASFEASPPTRRDCFGFLWTGRLWTS